MPTARNLVLPLAATALLWAGGAPAHARRSGESLPALIRYSVPAPLQARAGTTPQLSRELGSPGARTKARFVGHGDRHPSDHHPFDSRRYGGEHDRDDFDEATEHESHHMHHDHGHGDSPG